MAEKGQKKTVIVVGAGVGGIATAARLAKAGLDVTVVEKNDFIGGRCSLIHHDGYRFDQGPSLLLLPKLFQETFHDLSTSMPAEGVDLLKCEPNYNLWFGDGELLELSSDTAVMKREIEKYEGKAGFQRYLSWLSEAHAHYEISVTEVLHRNFVNVFGLLKWSFLKDVMTIHPFESIYSRASRYFYTERLRRAFTFGSMYMGMSPFDAPGTYSLLQYTELAEGIWYPVGGFNAVPAALKRIGERMGVKYRLNTPVSSVLTDGKKATGVLLASGEKLTADIVVVNADTVYAYNNLFSATPNTQNMTAGPSPYAKSLSKRDGSCSSISFYWALNTKIPQLTTHNIFLSDEYKESFDAIFTRQSIPDEPSFYVNVPSRIDSTAAPEGCDTLVVLVPTGHLLQSKIDSDGTNLSNGSLREPNGHANGKVKGYGIDKQHNLNSAQDWDNMVSHARDTILRTVSARLHLAPGQLEKAITYESVNTPKTWESNFNLDKGSILGLSHSFFNVLAFRPGIRHNNLKQCYFVGASTHPGTGVPIVLAGAKLTSEMILEDHGIEIPWSGWEDVVGDSGVKQHKGTNPIDRIRRSDGETYVWGGVVAVVLLLLGWYYDVLAKREREVMVVGA